MERRPWTLKVGGDEGSKVSILMCTVQRIQTLIEKPHGDLYNKILDLSRGLNKLSGDSKYLDALRMWERLRTWTSMLEELLETNGERRGHPCQHSVGVVAKIVLTVLSTSTK